MSEFTRVESNQYYQVQCVGCRGLGPLFAQVRRGQTPRAGPVQVHQDFRELASCATRCVACQVFQRALLLEQITVQDSDELYANQGGVYATIEATGDRVLLQLDVKATETSPRREATVVCSVAAPPPAPQGVPGGADWTQLRNWLSACDTKHGCRKFRWSNNNPSWLIQILGGDLIQLVRGSEASDDGSLVPYVVLSYCWGNQRSITAKDPRGWEKVQRAHTQVLAKGHPVIDRIRPFSQLEYPRALQDAIHITGKLGLEYIWIDSVCIPELDDWDVEATKMHEVYGNAYVTLYTCSSDKAIDPVYTRRRAWEHPVKPVRLFGYWLTSRDPSLAEVRKHNPLARRGWILQEEYLSPRMIFWCAQRAYWSCCERHATESRQPTNLTEAPPTTQRRPQEFMMLSRSGDSDKIQEEWLDLVASYTRRSLAEQGKEKDRFRAISGLAVRYLGAGNEDAPQRNEYLAGLWRQSFARHLAWRVRHSVDPSGNLRSVAPSWSWASLPLRTEVDLRHEFQTTQHFELLEANNVTATDSARDVVTKGALVRAVQVQGRLRRLIGIDSVLVPWEAVITLSNSTGKETFDMPLEPDQSIHARSAHGRIVVYEAHKEEILCQLDYCNLEENDEDLMMKVDEKQDIAVAANLETQLYCLEVGKSAMLLLEEVEDRRKTYRRTGVAVGYRGNFFDGYDTEDIVLE